MNYDGKAIVINTNINNYKSKNGYAVIHDKQCKTYYTQTNEKIIVEVIDKSIKVLNNIYAKNSSIVYGDLNLIPYTVSVYNERMHTEEAMFYYASSVKVKQKIRNKDYNDFKYVSVRHKTEKLQRTNIKYIPQTAIVTDLTSEETIVKFKGFEVNVTNKTEVIIPSGNSSYDNISIVVQKNCFIEMVISDKIIAIEDLPDDLEYLPGYIKGTFTKSGEYNVKLKYPDGEQILNIIVPYYQRLL